MTDPAAEADTLLSDVPAEEPAGDELAGDEPAGGELAGGELAGGNFPGGTLVGEGRYARFFQHIRQTALPYLPCAAGQDPAALHEALLPELTRVGAYGIPEGVGLAMHLYMLSAISTLPLENAALRDRRDFLMRYISASRLLVANTGSDNVLRSGNQARSGTLATKAENGYLVTGAKTFLSLAAVADLMLFTAQIDGRDGLFFFLSPIRQDSIRIGAPHFDSAYALATHHVDFDGLFVPDEMVFSQTDDNAGPDLAFSYQRAWFQSLIGAVYLGAARRALSEAACFANASRLPQGVTLAALDGVQADMGRLEVKWQAAMAACQRCSVVLARFKDVPFEQALPDFVEASLIAKHASTQAAEEIVAAARRFIGTRALEADTPMAEICRLVQFGPLHPTVGAQLERHFGRKLLSAEAKG